MNRIIAVIFFFLIAPAQAAVTLDRTRIIFPGTEDSVQVNISNTSEKLPYLAQAWIEDATGKKINTHFMIRPPIQRLETGAKSIIRIQRMPELSALPQDRESLFWFNLREIPSRSADSNTLQIALHSRIKIYYRPAAIIPEKYTVWEHQLVLHKSPEGFLIENPTPYYMTVIGITGTEKEKVDKQFSAVVIEPKSSVTVKSKIFNSPWVTTINDFGGRPVTPFTCTGVVCHAQAPTAG